MYGSSYVFRGPLTRTLCHIAAATFLVVLTVLVSGRVNAQELERKDVSGAWELLCRKGTGDLRVSDCALVQSVVAATANRNHWAKMGAEFARDGQINLTVQTPPLWQPKEGVILSIDGLQVGLLSVDECSTEFCSASILLGPPLMAQFLAGHSAEVQFPVSKREGISLPFDLAGFGEGLAILRRTVLALVADNSGGIIKRATNWLAGFDSNNKSDTNDKATKFRISVATVPGRIEPARAANVKQTDDKQSLDVEGEAVRAYAEKLCLSDRNIQTEVKPITVSLNSRLALSGSDERQLNNFANRAKKCSERTYFMIYPDPPENHERALDPTLIQLQKYEVKRYLTVRGIENTRILSLEKPNGIPIYMPVN